MANGLELWTISPTPEDSTTMASPQSFTDMIFAGVENPSMQVLKSTSTHLNVSQYPFISDCISGLKAGMEPDLTSDGTGGTYMLKDETHEALAVFKPRDEEPYAPENPRGYIGPLGSDALRSGVRSGEGYLREIAAYRLDHGNYSRVPETLLATVELEAREKIGSL